MTRQKTNTAGAEDLEPFSPVAFGYGPIGIGVGEAAPAGFAGLAIGLTFAAIQMVGPPRHPT